MLKRARMAMREVRIAAVVGDIVDCKLEVLEWDDERDSAEGDGIYITIAPYPCSIY